MYTCDIFNDIYRHGVVYDFITLNPILMLGSTADTANMSIKALDDEKVYTYKGTCLSDTEIKNEDSLSCEQYHNKYYVSSDMIYAEVTYNPYRVLFLCSRNRWWISMQETVVNPER